MDKLLAAYPEASVKHKDLSTSPIPHLEQIHLEGFYFPDEFRQPIHDEAARYSDEAVADLKEADIIVIEAPMYNLTIPSTLKAWMDHIVRNEVTYQHTPDGDIGLIHDKKVFVAMTAGYIYTEGEGISKDFVRPLLKAVLKSIGITDITFVVADGLSVSGVKETTFQKAVDSIQI